MKTLKELSQDKIFAYMDAAGTDVRRKLKQAAKARVEKKFELSSQLQKKANKRYRKIKQASERVPQPDWK